MNNKYIEILNLISKHIIVLNKLLFNFKDKTQLLLEYNNKGINVNKIIENINKSINEIELLLQTIYEQLCDIDKNLINYIDLTNIKSKIYIENNDKKKNKFCCC